MQRSTVFAAASVIIVILIGYATDRPYDIAGAIIGGVLGGWLFSEDMGRKTRPFAMIAGIVVGIVFGRFVAMFFAK